MSDKTELKPCPFCGGEAEVIQGDARKDVWAHGTFHRAYCTACQNRQLFHQTEAEAAAAWNRRSSVQEAAPDSDALKRERYLSRDLMDLLKSMFDAPTMDAGYAILTDFARQFWPEDPVALRAAPATAADGLTGMTPERRARDVAASLFDGTILTERRLAETIAAAIWEALSAARAVAPAGVPEGWKLVPVEPTQEMIDSAGGDCVDLYRADDPSYMPADVYSTMLSAAPAAPTAQGQDPLGKVRQAIADYHHALDTRQNGSVAENRALHAIEEALDARWLPDAEKARRSSAPSAGEA